MKKLCMFLLALSMNNLVIPKSDGKTTIVKIKSVVRTKKTAIVTAGALIGSFLVGGSGVMFLRYVWQRCNAKQANQNEKDQSNTTGIDTTGDVEKSDNTQSMLPEDKSEQDQHTQATQNQDQNANMLPVSINAEPEKVQNWLINQYLTDNAPEEFKGHWKVKELTHNNKKYFCIQIFEKSSEIHNSTVKLKAVKKQAGTILGILTRQTQILKTQIYDGITVLLRYYNGTDNGSDLEHSWEINWTFET